MSPAAVTRWQQANQAYLSACLALVRSRLEAHADGPARAEAPAAGCVQAVSAATAELPAPSALHAVCAAFSLSEFEREVLLLAAGIELDARFAPACGRAAGDSRRSFASFGLALAALPGGHWSALTPVAPLRRWRLIELAPDEPVTTAPLRIDERVLHYLAGISYLDERLGGVLESLPSPDRLPETHRRIADRLAGLLASDRAPRVVQLSGPECGGKSDIVAAAAASLERPALRLRLSDVPATPGERVAFARLCSREAALTRAVLFVLCDGSTAEAAEQAVASLLTEISVTLVLARREPITLERLPAVRFDVEIPDATERRELWRQTLGEAGDGLNGALDALALQFPLDAAAVRAASAAALQDGAEPELTATRLWEACRLQARSRLDDLAQRIGAVASWDDLVLPEPQLHLLREIAVHVRRASLVYHNWGFAAKGARGLGISALFAGASGTGKTMAAEVLAGELNLDLYRIDLSQTVSKYIGETEKNLRRIFDAAEQSGAILLFDEADALFGKRSEVKDSHDRYANIEVSYLLQRMEAYRGLAILTTNMKTALDPAFLRRIRFVVQFPFPDAAQRAEIWRRVFPSQTPTAALDFARLAKLNLAGGNIRNIALNAAFLAADQGAAVGMAHLLRAAQGEYAKLEKPLSATEIGGWA